MNSINTNMSALVAQENIQKQNREMNDAMARLSSGFRINSAADDAAGTAIASKMEAQVRSLDMAVRNSYDAISMTQTAEGALGEMENVLQRIREISVQAGNSTLSAADRSSIQKEVDALINELDSIASKTNFNGVKLLDGSRDSVTFQTGIDASDALNVALEKSDTTALGLKGGSFVNNSIHSMTANDNMIVLCGGTSTATFKFNHSGTLQWQRQYGGSKSPRQKLHHSRDFCHDPGQTEARC